MTEKTHKVNTVRSINIVMPTKRTIALIVFAAVGLIILITLLLLHGKSAVKYAVQIDGVKNNQLVTNCNAEAMNDASLSCKQFKLTGHATLDNDSMLLFKKDYFPNTMPDSSFALTSKAEEKSMLSSEPNSLNKYVNADGSFDIPLDTKFISSDDANDNSEEDDSLIIYNVKTQTKVAEQGLKVVYVLTAKDKTLKAVQLAKLQSDTVSNSSSSTSTSPTHPANDGSITDAEMKRLCEERISEKGISNPNLAISYFTKSDDGKTYVIMGTVKDGSTNRDIKCWYDTGTQAISYLTIDNK